ncbi:thrombospondin type 3 repeat-containing protein [Dietzia psychralcaliphila]|uniref:Uncharacterized protein n=1 Tax=Dietzia psychralcaliphila TaxID=139021 RepID=A0AAD0NQW4_9ACTN|nr:thrombospondin type 3 repeat-containing protein [Dietzia psychralcaliphila]AWH96539.1 hypothetical protein A6048_14755 [Dietzia psychralcaliphila]PTM90290.1 hypothetical protein C8N39_10142 [Dietzia psychralcaliphila]
MPNPTRSPGDTEPVRGTRPGRSRGRRKTSLIPVALATAVTLILGGASVARAVTATPLDAHADLEFSLDGATWSDAPDVVLGSWGCDLAGGTALSDPEGVISGTPEVDPCSMSPGESIDRTYYVRNATDTGRTGRYAVGVGEYLVSSEAEFDVSSTITGSVGTDSRTVTLYGADTPQATDSPARGSTVAALDLSPGQAARVVDEVSVPLDVENYAQRQSVSPMIWVSFSDIGVVDTDGDGLPDLVENQIGTDPTDPLNRLPGGTVGQRFGPEPFLPLTPEGTELAVDLATLPPGLRLEDGVLVGTPTGAGTYDVEFTVTMPGGAPYTSVRRVVIDSRSGGGSSDLPDLIWPVVIVGVIGIILGPGLGSLGDSIGGSLGGLFGGSSSWSWSGPFGGSSGSAAGDLLGGLFGPGGSTGSGSVPAAPATSTPATSTPATTPRPPSQSASPDGIEGTGQVAVNSVTPREGAPSSEWARANSQVRGSLAETGVGATDLLLWALTAAAAGVTLILLASRRRGDPEG